MTDGGVHPEASRPYLEDQILGADLTVYGQYILLLGDNDVHGLWDWKSGEAVTVSARLATSKYR